MALCLPVINDLPPARTPRSSTLLICSLEHSVTDKLTNEIISPPTLVPGSTYRVSISRSADGMVFPTDVGYIHAAIDMGFGMGP